MSEFKLRRLSVLAYAQGFTQWVYWDKEATLDQLLAPNFFSPAADVFATYDHIHASTADGGMILWVQSSSEKGGVVVKAMART